VSELEEKINGILSNPEEMARLTRMAQSLMGGAGGNAAETPVSQAKSPANQGFGESVSSDANRADNINLPGGIDPKTIQNMMGMLQSAGGGGVLEAILPHLAPKRQSKLGRAMQLAKMAKVAGAAFKTEGGGGIGGV